MIEAFAVGGLCVMALIITYMFYKGLCICRMTSRVIDMKLTKMAMSLSLMKTNLNEKMLRFLLKCWGK